MEKADLDTLKILEDMIRRVVREELERSPGRTAYVPTEMPKRSPLAGRVWGDPGSNTWGLDVPSVPPA